MTAKITREQAEEIRALYAAGGVTYGDLAKRFGLTKGGIGSILDGRSWK